MFGQKSGGAGGTGGALLGAESQIQAPEHGSLDALPFSDVFLNHFKPDYKPSK